MPTKIRKLISQLISYWMCTTISFSTYGKYLQVRSAALKHINLTSIFIFLLSFLCFMTSAQAGQLDREDIFRQQLNGRYTVGEIFPDMRAYPVFIPAEETPDGKPKLVGYAFETVDFTGTRGYSGKPINLFVFMDLEGRFLKIQLLEHTEPLFISIHDNAKLEGFAKQYVQLSFNHLIDIHGPNDPTVRKDRNVSLRGVLRGTISVKAIDRSIFAAAAKVALAKLDPANLGTEAVLTPPPADIVVTKAKSRSEDEAKVLNQPEEKPIILPSVTLPSNKNAPTSLATTFSVSSPISRVVTPSVTESSTAHSPEPSFLTGSDQSASVMQAVPNPPPANAQEQLQRIQSMADGGSTRQQWLDVWQSRRVDIAVLLLGLVILTTGLIAQKRMSAKDTRLRILRSAYLVFTVGFIGWYAQGQLSIINITGAIESLSSGGDLSFLMNDPITVILWVFVAGTLLVWGRGTFCGWLCPFGALQELISLIANSVGLQQKRLRAALDRQLKWLKYGVLATILVSIFAAPSFARIAIEVEPFKTAISLYFDREWPCVLWALLCLALGVFVYRGYCRYICPLGAALASLNFLQRWSWIPRHKECGTPCQSCRYKCEYQAIEDTGKVNYSECFQCLDCVSIYQDTKRCLPLIQERKDGNYFIPVQTGINA